MPLKHFRRGQTHPHLKTCSQSAMKLTRTCLANAAPPEKPQPVATSSQPGLKPPANSLQPSSTMFKTAPLPIPPPVVPNKKTETVEKLRTASTVQEKLLLLQQLQRQTTNEEASSAQIHQGNRMVDARAYSAALDGLRRANVELNVANQYIRHLEQQLDKRGEDLAAASSIMKETSLDYAEMGKLVNAALASVRYNAPHVDVKANLALVHSRLGELEKATKEQRQALQKMVPVKVPIKYDGGARSVRVMGSFDHWTRGVDLTCPNGDEGDSMKRSFENTLSLIPGTYAIKFVVDGQWRCAPSWPIESSKEGDNNVLQVDPLH